MRARRTVSAARSSAAEAEVIAALDRLLDPLESLSQERFRSECAQSTPREPQPAQALARPQHPDGRGQPWHEHWAVGMLVGLLLFGVIALHIWLLLSTKS